MTHAIDTDFMAELIRATTPAVWRACAALVDPESADDLCQETYAQALRSLPRFRGEAPVLAWLLAIARRVCADEISLRQRNRRLAAALRTHPVSPGSAYARIELADALARLPRARLEALLLTAVAGFSYAEAARQCGCAVGTIRSRVGRARSDLRLALRPDGHGIAVVGSSR